MNHVARGFLISGLLFAASAHGQAPTWSGEQAAVWTVVEKSWKDDAAENGKWPGDYAHDKFVSWGQDQPAPRDKDTYTKWERISNEASDTFWYEITPLAIAVEDDTAVVMYSLLSGDENSDGKRELSPFQVIEVLVRKDRSWKYLSSTTFTPASGN